MTQAWHPELGKGPRYLAIADALARDIRSGELAGGNQLPTHRELASRLGVTVGTVSRAYSEAERRNLVTARVGCGTFVREPSAKSRFVELRAGEEAVNLAMNFPPSPGDGIFEELVGNTLRELTERPDFAESFQYVFPRGAERHRQAGASWLGRVLPDPDPDRVLVTAGAQHAMAIALTSLTEPGDRVLCEALTFPGFFLLAEQLHLVVEPLLLDDKGIVPDAFEAACRRSAPRALYCVPTLHNPTGSVLPQSRRREIAKIADRHGVAIIEDDVHGVLMREPVKPIAAFAPDLAYYITNTAKSMAPGLRIGFLHAPSSATDALAEAINATTWMAPTFMAELVATMVEDGTAEQVLNARCDAARERMTLARRILAEHVTGEPTSAFHLWLPLPDSWSPDSLAAAAERRQVRLAPTRAFCAPGTEVPQAVRICLGAERDLAKLENGLRVLAELLEGARDRDLSVV